MSASLGARPLAQVMGACVYQLGVSGAPVLGNPGYREFYGRGRRQGSLTFEVRRVSSAYDRARETALARMSEQAACARAAIVVGVQLRLTEREYGETPTIDYLATGTALAIESAPPAGQPRLTTLSAADYFCLRAAGYDVVGIATATSIQHVRPGADTVRVMTRRWRAALPNQEIPEFSAAATAARAACERRMREQATRSGATGIVAMSLDITHSTSAGLRGDESAGASRRYRHLHVTVHGLGTIVKPRRPPTDGPRVRSRPVLWLD